MNCEEAKQKIGIKEVLETFNLFPIKSNRKTAFYYALDREESVPSLSVDYVKNTAFDFGTGRSYDVISIVQILNKCNVSEALKYLEKIDLFVVNAYDGSDVDVTQKYKITKVAPITHCALVEYLESRKVSKQIMYVKEVHYEINSKKYFGIGFFNNSGGIEIRNKYSKICLGKKDITLIESELKSKKDIVVFEGFFDFLTYRNMNVNDLPVDYLILNSTAMFFKAEEMLKSYDTISLFLDNDQNGNSTKKSFKSKYKNVEDCSLLYSGFKDLNDWFTENSKS